MKICFLCLSVKQDSQTCLIIRTRFPLSNNIQYSIEIYISSEKYISHMSPEIGSFDVVLLIKENKLSCVCVCGVEKVGEC